MFLSVYTVTLHFTESLCNSRDSLCKIGVIKRLYWRALLMLVGVIIIIIIIIIIIGGPGVA